MVNYLPGLGLNQNDLERRSEQLPRDLQLLRQMFQPGLNQPTPPSLLLPNEKANYTIALMEKSNSTGIRMAGSKSEIL